MAVSSSGWYKLGSWYKLNLTFIENFLMRITLTLTSKCHLHLSVRDSRHLCEHFRLSHDKNQLLITCGKNKNNRIQKYTRNLFARKLFSILYQLLLVLLRLIRIKYAMYLARAIFDINIEYSFSLQTHMKLCGQTSNICRCTPNSQAYFFCLCSTVSTVNRVRLHKLFNLRLKSTLCGMHVCVCVCMKWKPYFRHDQRVTLHNLYTHKWQNKLANLIRVTITRSKYLHFQQFPLRCSEAHVQRTTHIHRLATNKCYWTMTIYVLVRLHRIHWLRTYNRHSK